VKCLFALLEEANHTDLRGWAGRGRCLITPKHRAAAESGQQLNCHSDVYSTETYRTASKTYPPSSVLNFKLHSLLKSP